ncbi:MAG: HyaD/HybD family hydrogenase maturation endopeptidase [Anaerolineae bacterium]
MAGQTLVLGLGNTLLGDEGIGVHVVCYLKAVLPPVPNLVLLDGGTLGLELLPYIEEASRVVVVDCMCSGRPPGTVSVLRGREASEWQTYLAAAHDLGLPNVLALAHLRGWRPEELVVIGIEPLCLGPGLELSAEVAKGRDEAAIVVTNILSCWGIVHRERPKNLGEQQ